MKKLLILFVVLNLLLPNGAEASENSSWTSWLRPVTAVIAGAVTAVGYHYKFQPEKKLQKPFNEPKTQLAALNGRSTIFNKIKAGVEHSDECNPFEERCAHTTTKRDFVITKQELASEPEAQQFISQYELYRPNKHHSQEPGFTCSLPGLLNTGVKRRDVTNALDNKLACISKDSESERKKYESAHDKWESDNQVITKANKAAQQSHTIKCVGIGAAAGIATLGALSWFANNNK